MRAIVPGSGASRALAGDSLPAVRESGASRGDELATLQVAAAGDEDAFRQLTGRYLAELRSHCYRILGSVHDAEDALQDTLLRAWRGLPGFAGRSSVRTWLYAIATNAALDIAKRRSRRELPVDFGPAAPAGAALSAPLTDAPWLEPYPDQWLAAAARPSPEAQYEQRESIELAFVVALQQLPPLQRAALLLREVAGLSAAEISGQLGTSAAAVNSALQRARAATRDHMPDRSQQATLRMLGDQRTKAIVEQYADALERGDADTLISMLTADATWSMPPNPTWYHGPEAIRQFLVSYPLLQRWRHVPTRANGHLAVACYILDKAGGGYLPHCIDVLTMDGDKIAAVTAFFPAKVLSARVSARQTDEEAGAALFARFGLPAQG
jgi:RNA polymerase sigma-70 factor, ECF subfamily